MQFLPLFRRIIGQLLGCFDHVFERGSRPLDHGQVERRRGILPRFGQAQANGGRDDLAMRPGRFKMRLSILRVIGGGKGIRTLDPNLGKRRCNP